MRVKTFSGFMCDQRKEHENPVHLGNGAIYLITRGADDIKQFISHSIHTSVIRIGVSMENENRHMEKKR